MISDEHQAGLIKKLGRPPLSSPEGQCKGVQFMTGGSPVVSHTRRDSSCQKHAG